MGLVFKIPMITVHEQQTEMDEVVPNEHEWYLPFNLSHYCSYLKNEIKPFYLICTVKSHELLSNLICLQEIL